MQGRRISRSDSKRLLQEFLRFIKLSALRALNRRLEQAVGLRDLFAQFAVGLHLAPSLVVPARRQKYLPENVTGFLVGRIALDTLSKNSDCSLEVAHSAIRDTKLCMDTFGPWIHFL